MKDIGTKIEKVLVRSLMVICGVLDSIPNATAAYDIGKEFVKEDFWKKNKSAFDDSIWIHGPWGKNTSGTSLQNAVSCFGVPVWTTTIRFSEGGVDNVELIFFDTKGPMVPKMLQNGATSYSHVPKKIRSAEFDELVKGIVRKFEGDDILSAKRKSDVMKQKGTYAFEMDLKGVACGLPATLKWCYKRKENKSSEEAFAGEYITLSVMRPDFATCSETNSLLPVQAPKMEGVIKENGDVFIAGIDVLDRGHEDMSCVAAFERILRFYEIDVGKRELDSLAAEGGEFESRWIKLKNAIGRMGKRCKFRADIKFDDIPEVDIEQLSSSAASVFIAQYNKTAGKMKKDRLSQTGAALDAVLFREGVDPEVFKRMMTTDGKYAGKQKAFYKYVCSRIDKGAPILWRAETGLFKSQDEDNHMRMGVVMPWIIIGYSSGKRELLYLDRERGGRDFKRIPYDWAWAITRGTLSLDMQKRRK